MQGREEIERMFREIGVEVQKEPLPNPVEEPTPEPAQEEPEPQIFVRIHSTTAPIECELDAHLA
jgi:hypothetical protein